MELYAGREVVASAARTESGQSGAIPLPPGSRKIAVAVDVTDASGTTPTLDLAIEWSSDGGTTWFAGDTADTLAQITAAKKTAKAFDVKGRHYRVKWTVGGTTPSFTFAVDDTPLG